MDTQNYSATFLVDQTPAEVFAAINKVSTWWSEDFTGASEKLDDEFSVHFGDVHHSTQKLVEVTPDTKVVWLVAKSQLNFLKGNKAEWAGTTISFDITPEGDKTKLIFNHYGLVPEIECFKDCSKGWDYYLQQSLIPYITTGQPNPNKKSNH